MADERYGNLTHAQKAEMLELAERMDRVKQIPGGTAFQVDLLLATAIKAGMTVVETAKYDGLYDALDKAINYLAVYAVTTKDEKASALWRYGSTKLPTRCSPVAPPSRSTDMSETKWVLVPVEPTTAMLDAGETASWCEQEIIADHYRAMIEAAPSPPASPADAGMLEEAMKVMEFYANPEIYKPHPHGPAFDDRDLSFLARSWLARAKGATHG